MHTKMILNHGQDECSSMKNESDTMDGESTCSYEEACSITVASGDTYVTDIALNKPGTHFAVSTSNQEIKCYSVETQTQVQTFTGYEKPISSIKFSHESPDLLYTSSLDGIVRLWDLREKTKNGPAQQYFDDTDGKLKPLCTFDLSVNENYICGGTELVREDAFLIFWDKRTAANLGGYWHGHTDDITHIKYHPFENSIMATASTDGLMNVYDLSQECEDDALIYTLNTESSVANIAWNSMKSHELPESELACITHTEEMQLWRVDDVRSRISLNRNTLGSSSKIQTDYLIGMLSDDHGSVYLVSGQRHAAVNVWMVNGCNVNLWASLKSSHKDDVRAVTWNPTDKQMFTGGEDGLVCIWKLKGSKIPGTVYKMQSHLKKLSLKHTQKPY